MSGMAAADVVIFGGGAAGLWTLDVLAARGARALLVETHALGAGQTVASQGIIHGGLKYSLQGLLTKSAANIREMPGVWRECLAGERVPNLAGVRMRADFCHLWRTDDLTSRLGMIGATLGLHVTPDVVADGERPDVLRGCPGTVARLAEPVVSPASFVEVLRNKNLSRLLKADPGGIDFHATADGTVREVRIACGREELALRPRLVLFVAGAGNAGLLELLGRTSPAMQRRPLHMAMVRGRLPDLNGHCVDGAKTRVTVTTERLADGQAVWQVGGQIAEDGVELTPYGLIQKAKSELETVLPGLDLRGADWATYRVDRAEAATGSGQRPDDVQLVREANVITAWPTKLAFAPELARAVARQIDCSDESAAFPGEAVREWPRPDVSASPWETAAWLPTATAAAA